MFWQLETLEGRWPGLGPSLVGGSLGTPGGVDALFCVQLLSRVRLFATPWTIAHQVPLATRFPRQQYWSGSPCPPPGDPPHQGSNPGLPHCRRIPYHLSPQGSPGGVDAPMQLARLASPPWQGHRPAFHSTGPHQGQGRVATAVGKEGFLGGKTLHYSL